LDQLQSVSAMFAASASADAGGTLLASTCS
jgi:hypothetical protein